MAEPEIRRRRRPAVSCTLCRRRKIRCNREQPCSNCLRARKNVACVYEELPPVASTQPASAPVSVPEAVAAITPETSVSSTNSEPGYPALNPPRGNGSLDAGIVIRELASHQQPRTDANGTIHHRNHQNHQNHDSHENYDVAPRQGATVTQDILFEVDDDPASNSASRNAPSSFNPNVGIGLPEYRHSQRPEERQKHQTGQSRQKRQKRQEQQGKDKDLLSLKNRIQSLEKQLERRLVQFEQHTEQQLQQQQDRNTNANPNTPSATATHTGFPGAVAEDSQITPVSYITIADPPMHNAITRQSHASESRRSRHSRSTSPHRNNRKRRHTQSRSPACHQAPGHRYGCSAGTPQNSIGPNNASTNTPSNSGFSHPQVVSWPSQPRSMAGDFHVSTTQLRVVQNRHGTAKGINDKDRHGRKRHKEHTPRYTQHMHMTSRSVMHKTRLFGQSHWANSIVGFRDIFEMIDPLVTEDNDPQAAKVFADLQRLKHLARVIKAQRIGSPSATPVHLQNINTELQPIRQPADLDLPPRALADELVACYMRSTESMFRILHVPMFRREYEAVWGFPSNSGSKTFSKHDSAFLAQLKLVLAIGASTHADHVGLRARAVRWLYAAQAWHAEPEYKAHLTMQTLQIHVLLLFAREAVGIGGALTWIAVGDLVRSAVYMGLHRDPARLPKRMSLLAAEMRRRLWNTILELVVATSIDAGGPAMLSLSDFDAKPPANLNDEALEEASLVSAPHAGLCMSRVRKVGPEGRGEEQPKEQRKGPQTEAPATKRGVPKRVYVSDGEMRGVPPYETISEMLDAERGDGVWKEDGRDDTAEPRPAESDVDDSGSEDDEEDRDDDDDDGDDNNNKIDEFTPTSVAIALRRTWPLRLQICKFVNNMGPPGSYADTLHLDRKFRAAYRSLCETMQHFNEGDKKVSPLLMSSVDLVMKRYMLCLHVPFFGAAMQDETAYAYSRRVVLETALRVWHTCCPGADADAEAEEAEVVDPELVRQAMLGCGPLRRLSMQASLLVAAELKLHLLEEEGVLGAPSTHKTPLRPDLLAVVQAATHWCLRGVEAGETNFKGYLLWRLILVQLDGMRRGMMGSATATVASRMAVARELVEEAEEAETRCMPIMEGMVTQGYQAMGLLKPVGASPSEGESPDRPSRPVHPDHSEVNAIARACHTADCPCQAPYREQLEREQREKQQRKVMEEQQQQQQQQYEQMQAFVPIQMPIQMPMSTPMAMPYSTQTLDAADLPVDNWEFLMPSDAQSLMDSNEPLSWLFSGEAGQNIMW